MKESIGVCLGASTVSFVSVREDTFGIKEIVARKSIQHNGDTKGTFIKLLSSLNELSVPIVVTGRKFRHIVNLTTISEPEAVEKAYQYIYGNTIPTPSQEVELQNFSAVASLGGETFMVYCLAQDGRINNIISKNQCASGTGEFFLQQIKRMNLDVNEAMSVCDGVEPYKVSGRCSVFCKSDCTHALNKGKPVGEVTSGLSLMIAEKIEELLLKSKGTRFLLIGGLTQNYIVMDFLRKKNLNIEIPNEAACFEALGAALYGLENEVLHLDSLENIFNDKSSSFVFHKPLQEFSSNVSFKNIHYDTAHIGDRCILGLDVGSTTTKAVVIREADDKILGSVYLYTNGNPIKASMECYKVLNEKINADIEIIGLGVTGSGRYIAGLHALTDGIINEIVAHATAAVYFDPEVDTIFEIGGQDAKYTYLINKVPSDYAMNEACSAGTGSFIEESAWESLRVKVDEIESIAMRAAMPPNFSDQCAAFISSDIKTAQQEGIGKDDIVAGLVYSVCLNYVNRVKGARPVGNKIFMQGGVCYNKAIPVAMAALTDKKIIVPPEPGLMGAFGVALEVKEKLRLGFMTEKSFSLSELAEREVNYKMPFGCKGGTEHCDRNCTINLIEVQGKKYPFGGACNKYYNFIHRQKIDPLKYDYVRRRQELIFEKYSPKLNLPENVKTIGMNLSFHTHTLYPLYHQFFSKLGYRIILSDTIRAEGIEREMASMCYPTQISHGMFLDLLEKKPDYIFVPNHLEMFCDEGKYQRLDFNCSCIFVSGEPYFLKQAFKDYNLNGQYLTPIFNFGNGYEPETEKFIKLAHQLGARDDEKIKNIYYEAISIQNKFTNELYKIGNEFLEYLEANPEETAIVLVGRPYNAFTGDANKGIPRKFSSRGVYVIPYDMLDCRTETIDDDMYWEGGKKILKVAKFIKRHPQLFAAYISNFSCAPDSILIPVFRNIMGTKPSLTLELDGHTADAGIDTRIEAALDIIKNYRKIYYNVNDPDYSDYKMASVKFSKTEGFFNTSEGESVPLNDSRVQILVPGMGDIASKLFAAGLRGQGFNAVPLNEGNTDILKYGRAVTTGKECLPLLLCTGAMLDYIENKWDGRHYLAFFIVQGAGNCRLGYYPAYMRDVIRKKKIRNVTTIELMHEDGFAGLGPDFALRGIQALITSDVLDDIRSGIMANAINPDEGVGFFNEELMNILDITEHSPKLLFESLNLFAENIRKNIPAKRPIEMSKYIALVGEIYVRRDHFSHKYLNKYFAKKGFIVKDAYVSEWIFYVDYLLKKGLYEPLKSIRNKYERLVRVTYMRYAERRIKKILEKSGYYKYYPTRIDPLVKHGQHIVPLEFKGEPLLIVGSGIYDSIDKYSGIVSVGPFGCMQSRFAEAITVPEMNIENKVNIRRLYDPDYKLPSVFNGLTNIPFLAIETDGNAYPQVVEARLEAFTLQAERISRLIEQSKNGKNRV